MPQQIAPMKNLTILFIILLTALLVGCATPEGLDRFKGQSAEQIFQSGEKSLAKGSNRDAIEHFEAFEALYPYSKHTRQVQLNIIYAYYAAHENNSAIAAADRYLHLYPRGPDADYVLYMRAITDLTRDVGYFSRHLPIDIAPRDMNLFRQAFFDLRDLVIRYPYSIYTADARQRMVYLRNLFAQHEFGIAQYYYERDAYVAAISRANKIISYYQRSPIVVDALALMVKSYAKLGLADSAKQALLVLEINYPKVANKLKTDKNIAKFLR